MLTHTHIHTQPNTHSLVHGLSANKCPNWMCTVIFIFPKNVCVVTQILFLWYDLMFTLHKKKDNNKENNNWRNKTNLNELKFRLQHGSYLHGMLNVYMFFLVNNFHGIGHRKNVTLIQEKFEEKSKQSRNGFKLKHVQNWMMLIQKSVNLEHTKKNPNQEIPIKIAIKCFLR